MLKLSESEEYSLIRSNNGRVFYKDMLIENFQADISISPTKFILDYISEHIKENVDNIDKHNSDEVIERWQEQVSVIGKK